MDARGGRKFLARPPRGPSPWCGGGRLLAGRGSRSAASHVGGTARLPWDGLHAYDMRERLLAMHVGGNEGLGGAVDAEAAGDGRGAGELMDEGTTNDNPKGPVLYKQRWVQLALLACLALLSDMVCFSLAAVPDAWEATYGENPSSLIDMFLFTNVLSCLLVTDTIARVGQRRAIVGASCLMTLGCLLRSGVPFIGALPTYDQIVAGTVLVGAAQPFFQCTPPLLSATWFGAKERALATAVAINANQVGIGSAFLVGGAVLTNGGFGEADGLNFYFSLITLASAILSAATILRFDERPLTPPSLSAANKLAEAAEESRKDDSGGSASNRGGLLGAFKFPSTALQLLKTPGFMMPLVAFVTSIGVSNVVSAFTEATLNRAGMSDQTAINLSGAGFQLAIVIGGIILGGYVDRTKEYKEVTLACLSATMGLLVFLGFADGFDLNFPSWVVVVALFGLGATVGPIQPINAELAVEVTYPADETSIEAVQQMCGNLFSALLVPLCEYASHIDYDVDYNIRANLVTPDEDMRGDSIVLIILVLVAGFFFSRFNSPLRRSLLDGGIEGDACDEAVAGMVCAVPPPPVPAMEAPKEESKR